MITPNYISRREAAITVILDTRETYDKPRHFRCSCCGNIVFEYVRPVHIILAGSSRPVQAPTIVQCPHSIRVPRDDGTFSFVKCKTRYYIIQ